MVINHWQTATFGGMPAVPSMHLIDRLQRIWREVGPCLDGDPEVYDEIVVRDSVYNAASKEPWFQEMSLRRKIALLEKAFPKGEYYGA